MDKQSNKTHESQDLENRNRLNPEEDREAPDSQELPLVTKIKKSQGQQRIDTGVLSRIRALLDNEPDQGSTAGKNHFYQIKGLRLFNSDQNFPDLIITQASALSNPVIEGDLLDSGEVIFSLANLAVNHLSEKQLSYQIYARFHNLVTREERLVKSEVLNFADPDPDYYYIAPLESLSLSSGQYQVEVFILSLNGSIPLSLWQGPNLQVI
ncbi:MAG: hypothetical protein KGQ93_10465 [Cyanobacteria bacterium REEB459]|nr:hypothetical protein [Cyanobacteria bacterium REEB459]